MTTKTINCREIGQDVRFWDHGHGIIEEVEVSVSGDSEIEPYDYEKPNCGHFGAIMAVDLKGIWYSEAVSEWSFRRYLLPWNQVVGLKVYYAT